MAGLLDTLRQFGAHVQCLNAEGFPPIQVHGGDSIFSEARSTLWTPGQFHIEGRDSSQFLSALLMVAPLAQSSIELKLDGPLVSEPYVRMTIDVMRSFGVLVGTDGTSFWVDAPSTYDGGVFEIEPDATSAGYFFAAAAIDGGRVTILDLHKDRPQGDIRFVDILQEMGCRVDWCEAGLTLHGRPLHGIEVDMNDISDCVPTLAAVACFADGPTTIRNVAHIRRKESDRIAAVATELRKVGAEVDEMPDGLRITPRTLHGARIDPHNDHRIAMSMALIGLEVPGIIIDNPGCVAKTYPAFWDDLDKLWN
jgi:3-phosphoshikimate 1-carboxyvinyltransferase